MMPMFNPDFIFEQVKQEIFKVCPTYNVSQITLAYNYAKEKHASCPCRKTGEPYICHPARVALILASAGMESDMIAAAFLHDVLEDCNVSREELEEIFGSNIARIVDGVTKLKQTATMHMTKEELDNRSYHKLLKHMKQDYRVIYVKLADRLDNLRTMDNMGTEKMLNKLQETENFYLPLAEYLNIHLFIPEIRNWIFKLRNPPAYEAIESHYEQLLKTNAKAIQKTENLMKLALHNLTEATKELVSLQQHVKKFFMQKRTISSISRVLEKRGIDFTSEESLRGYTKYNTALYDIYLIMDNTDITPLDSFYRFYQNYLMEHGILINQFGLTKDGTQPYLKITDCYNVTYRLFLHTLESYNYYIYGIDSTHTDENDAKLHNILLNFDEEDPRKTYAPKITVKAKNGRTFQIDADSTVLDFAFFIHSELGLNMQSAIINGDLETTNLATRLHQGDQVVIQTVPEGTPCPAKLEWFRWINTAKAKKDLYRWLNNSTIQISILDKNRRLHYYRPKNSTVLDHLLLFEEDIEKLLYDIQHVSRVTINDKKCDLFTTLHHRDGLEITYTDQVVNTPDIKWIINLYSRESREKLIRILYP